MDQQILKACATKLLDAEFKKQEVTRITMDYPDLTIEDAYAIQQELTRQKIEKNRLIGYKMGLTSRAKMEQMKVNEPIYGCVFDYMVIPDQGVLNLEDVIHPKVEVEIAVVLAKDLEGPGVTGAQALAACEYILPALEIIDSRYENFNFTLVDVIADNASTSRLVLGNQPIQPDSLKTELDLMGASITINGQLEAFGIGAAVLGHPANAIAMLANMLAAEGKKLEAGQLVLTGGITAALTLSQHDIVQAKLDGLGELQFIVR